MDSPTDWSDPGAFEQDEKRSALLRDSHGLSSRVGLLIEQTNEMFRFCTQAEFTVVSLSIKITGNVSLWYKTS